MNNIIELKEVSYSYEDGFMALKNVSLGFERGRTTALIGCNGAGKSTLLLNLNAVKRPNSGTIFYNGVPYDYSKRGIINLRKNVGIVFQNPDAQLFSASVYEDISYGPLNLGLSEKEVRENTENALIGADIYNLRDRAVHTLSYGQKKKVAIAGILAMKPEVMVLDEPTAGLDPKGSEEIMTNIKKIQEEMDLTVIISTHDMNLIPEYCDHVHVISGGELKISGDIPFVFSHHSIINDAGLSIPTIGLLLEKLNEDGFNLDSVGYTIKEAESILKRWKDRML